MIDIQNLSFHFGLRTLFEDTSVMIQDGQKVGLVGPNGCGKSTLFKLIEGKFSPDGGKIEISRSTQIVSVAQEIEDPSVALLSYVLSADTEITRLEKELENPQISGEHMAEVFDRLEFLGAHSAQARASAILSGLGFLNTDFTRPLKEFSGGWQVRANLAAALYAPSNCLLLDEPTNHLDLETALWLENYLTRLDKTVFIISHDRHILNRLCDKIIHVEDTQLKLYNGNYDTYERTRAAAIEGAKLAAAKHERVVAHLQSFVDRFRYKATKAKQAQSRIKMIEKLGAAPQIPKDPQSHFEFPSPERLQNALVTIEGGVAGYNETPVLENLNLRIEPDDRIALLGANGNGKSTLAKILSHRLLLMSGKMTMAKKMKIAYFSQHQTEELDVEKTPYEQLSAVMPLATETQIRAQLGAFGLNKDKSDTLIGKLSGGEKSRLLLALITKDAPHLLILDEPTNHLDLQSRQALLEALNEYTGAVVLITHDLHVIELTCDTLWIVRRGTCENFMGDLEDYKAQLLKNNNRNDLASDKMTSKEMARKQAAERRAKLAPLKKEIRALDEKIAQMTARKQLLEEQLVSAYSADSSIELALLTSQLKDAEEDWLRLNEECEAAQK
ncbi:ATP-binding cassette domain-containing protein [Candidatus Avelusimicrobium luingense]|uniref:ABC-F family ATP-binding cassette domain-containing protein n=1 Tax=Candidatus Avelusimicrobium luingense TaxID=3416211 RepID=UPI003D0FDABF